MKNIKEKSKNVNGICWGDYTAADAGIKKSKSDCTWFFSLMTSRMMPSQNPEIRFFLLC